MFYKAYPGKGVQSVEGKSLVFPLFFPFGLGKADVNPGTLGTLTQGGLLDHQDPQWYPLEGTMHPHPAPVFLWKG